MKCFLPVGIGCPETYTLFKFPQGNYMHFEMIAGEYKGTQCFGEQSETNWPTRRLNKHIVSETNIILYQVNEMTLADSLLFFY